jgi:hypothetical protein
VMCSGIAHAARSSRHRSSSAVREATADAPVYLRVPVWSG